MDSVKERKIIAVTMGDPGGIAPEIVVKALSTEEVRGICRPLVIGDVSVIEEAVHLTGVPFKVEAVSTIPQYNSDRKLIEVLDIKSDRPFEKKISSRNAGSAVVKFIKVAVDLALKKKVDAIVTGPISKESLKMADCNWPGHTEMLAELTGSKNFAMMFVSTVLKVILCTIHIPLKEVPEMISQGTVLSAIELAKLGSRMMGVKFPKIAVAGLNPHAGESGIMGVEEKEHILPAVERARELGIDVYGPFPPDVVFYKAYKGEFDIVVCMYHDQGLIPFKMLAFDSGVNMTVGLPVVRTSPDHGTGFDIAWSNQADPSSMIEAIKLAVKVNLTK